MGHWRSDGYFSAVLGGVRNVFNGLGIGGADRTASNHFSHSFRDDRDLTSLYLSNGLAARIVDSPADDAMARGFEIEGDDPDGTIMAECDRLKLPAKMSEAIRWSRLYGGSVMILFAKNTGELSEPFDGKLDRLDEIKVFDVTSLTPVQDRVYRDPALPNWGFPELYNVKHPILNETFPCHESRMIMFSGDAVPAQIACHRDRKLPWRGRGALDGCYDNLIRYVAGLGWSERMMERKQQAVYSMVGLGELISHGMESEAQKHVDLVDLVRGVMNTVVIDGGTDGTVYDKYEVRDLNLSGVTDQINQFQVAICSDTGFPVTVLFGRSPAGQNATGESDQEGYYRLVGHVQANDAAPAMERVITLILAQTSFTGARPPEWKLKFNPLWLPSDKDQAQADLYRGQASYFEAQAAEIYATKIGSITNVEVRDHLEAQDRYGIEGEIDEADLEAMQPPTPVVVPAEADPVAPAQA